MREPRTPSPETLAVALIIAILLQFPLMWVLYVQTRHSGPGFSMNRPRSMVAHILPRKPKEKKDDPEDPSGVVIQLPEPPEPEIPPKETKFLANTDRKAEKETKARERTPEPSKTQGKVRVKEKSQVQSPHSDSAEPTQLPQEVREAQLPRPQDELKQSEAGTLPPKSPLATSEKAQLLMPATSGKNALANIQALSGISASDDALLEIEEEADETETDAKAFRYWDFFDRVKTRVRDEWTPSDAYRRNDPTGRVHGVRDRLTVLRVTLDARGNVVQMSTEKPSGLDFLDREARRAMRSASPFTNPPQGLVDERGLIEFQFGFLFEISSGRPKFYWKRM